MGHGSKSRVYKDRAKNRLDDLQSMFTNLQSARKDSRTNDVAVIEEQMNQMLREWKNELNEPSPATSLLEGDSLGSFFSSEMIRMLHLSEEQDDATSALAETKPDPDVQNLVDGLSSREGFNMSEGPQQQVFPLVDQLENTHFDMGVTSMGVNNTNVAATQFEHHQFDHHQGEFGPHYIPGFDGPIFYPDGGDVMPQLSQENICPPPPAAFLGPKCALWDCARPALEICDYCSTFHAGLAPSEGYPGGPPVIRPAGIVLKDNLLFAALGAKAQGKDVGIPECEGAATSKSPWNAPDLFDLALLNEETIREWLFFDKPRRAFESGNRKQRSLPDYVGRGWHESRKQVMNEFGGLKRSYYMDPQPFENFEWHLYEYEVNNYDAFALYRLEFKRVDRKKTPKGKSSNAPIADLQKQMGKANLKEEGKQRAVRGRGKANPKSGNESVYNIGGDPNALVDPGERFGYVGDAPIADYLVENIDGKYIT